MKCFLASVFLFLSINANAQFSAVVVAYGAGDVPVNTSIDIDAEYVAMPVSLVSDAKYPSQRAELIRELQSVVSDAASKNTNINFQQGVISLSPKEKSSFSISTPYGQRSSSSFYILSKLGDDKDLFAATQDIYSFIGGIHKLEDTGFILGHISLAVSSPRNYRDQLLEKIKNEVASLKNILGSSYQVEISGLENAVIVQQKNDKQVTLFINYQIEFRE